MTDLSSTKGATSTGLGRLYQAIDGRTKGPWKLKEMVPEWDGDASYEIDIDGELDSITDLRYYNSAPNRVEDARFIALMGSCADELAAVLRAAGEVAAYRGPLDNCSEVDELSEALTALANKVKEVSTCSSSVTSSVNPAPVSPPSSKS